MSAGDGNEPTRGRLAVVRFFLLTFREIYNRAGFGAGGFAYIYYRFLAFRFKRNYGRGPLVAGDIVV